MAKFIFFVFAFLLLPSVADAATRDFTVTWQGVCETTAGDDLDLDDDGFCEELTSYRFYTEEGGFITAITNVLTDTHTFRHNAPWGTQCFKMKAVMVVDFADGTSQTFESDYSNVGGCEDVRPGNPNAPSVTN